jgi:membrane peptidoglycan carboxypeptidase
MSPATTRTIAGMLESVVDSGTATAAQLSRYAVAGKSGTARRAVGRRGYVAGRYNSSFVALFPADRPQLVVVVRMIDPTVPNSYGGATAGTVVRELLRGTLALPDILDRGGLREVVRPAPTTLARVTPADPTTTASAAGTLVPDHVADAPRPVLVLPDPPVEHQERRRVGEVGRRPDTPAPRTGAVPDVQGRTLREAVRALHGAGFRVVLTDAALGTTTPAAGRVLPAGALVQLGRGR